MTEALGLIAVVLAIAANTAALWLKMTDLSKEMGRLAGRFDQFEKQVDARFDQFEKRVDTRFDAAEARADERSKEVQRRLDRIDARLDKVPS